MKFSQAMLTAILISIFVQHAVAQDEAEHFELSITGPLVEKLEPGTRISVGTLGTSKKHPYVGMSTSVDNLPLYLPKEHFQNRYLRVYFQSQSLKTMLFSMEIDSSLMDVARPIKLKLDKPRPNLRTTVWWDRVRYKASVTQRMAYMDLPYWDKDAGRLIPAPNQPMLSVDNGDGRKKRIEMGGLLHG